MRYCYNTDNNGVNGSSTAPAKPIDINGPANTATVSNPTPFIMLSPNAKDY